MSKTAVDMAEDWFEEAFRAIYSAREFMVAAGVSRPEANQLYDLAHKAISDMYDRAEKERKT